MPNVPSKDPAAPAIEEARLYRLRVLEGAPADNITVGGQCFAKQTEAIRFLPDGRTSRLPVAGQVVPLYAEDVARIKAAMEKRVVRWGAKATRKVTLTDEKTGETVEQEVDARRGQILYIDGKTRRLKTDEPLSKYLAIEDTDEIPSTF